MGHRLKANQESKKLKLLKTLQDMDESKDLNFTNFNR